MSGFIEDFYYGNIEPQECCSELKSELKKKLNSLTEKEESLISEITVALSSENCIMDSNTFVVPYMGDCLESVTTEPSPSIT